MGGDMEHWKRCLVSSIQLFCRNFCQYDSEAKIDGLLAITLDKKEVILIKLQETDSNEAADKTGISNQPSKEQSEQLESILRYLAPSCRLLKKAPVRTSVVPPVWQPVNDSSSDMPDRCNFMRSLGLVPTALVASNHAIGSSHIACLKASLNAGSSVNDSLGCIPTSEHCAPKGSANVMAKVDHKKKDNYFTVYQTETVKQVAKRQQSVIRTDANCSENMQKNTKCNQPSGVKLKAPLTSSHSINCNTDVRVCLDFKSVGQLMKEQNSVKASGSAAGRNVSKKPVKLLRKQRSSVAVSQAIARVKAPFDGSKKQSKLELNCGHHKNENKKVSSKQKNGKVKANNCTLHKKSYSSESDDELPLSEAVRKTGSKRKEPVKSSAMAADLKKKIASRKLLNKTKASRLKALYGKQRIAKKGHLDNQSELVRRTKTCGTCSGCKVKENCRVCIFCKDMKQYGGPSKLHKKCCMRQCRMLLKKKHGKSVSSKSSRRTDKDSGGDSSSAD